ncbi:glycoside hydrolase [Epithele typhae]|uniref:glycoside hydrolase n=1 Tax=Epithele typhae TaxID=378194 RepID=UPI0020072593|nr:glycoside hydrolase [Epithele typhae]KAH9920229.1 glycoside hydrolase [Epithele typhae]
MFRAAALSAFIYLATVAAQQAGTSTTETHPPLQWSQCTSSGCTTVQGSVVLDANWRWVHNVGGYTNCYTGNTWDATYCPDGATCAKNCALDGADYSGTYGVTTSGNALKLNFVTGSNVGSRLYLLKDASTYQTFNLLNQEFTFDVDLSTLPCGLNGALYFSAMDATGNMGVGNNAAGAKYGTGYCDSQCPKDIKFINGVANSQGWNGTSANSGTGTTGACCSEMDIWEANKMSAAYTPHPCTGTSLTACTGSQCTSTCDQAGCDFNSYRMGAKSFYGPGMTVDTTKKITVVTQFITTDGTANGDLSEIRRFYVQNGVVIPNSQSTVSGVSGNSLTTDFCSAQKTAFGDTNTFQQLGGLKQMGAAFKKGMVLVLSIWDDYAVNMLWLDSDYPTNKDASSPGVARGTCATTSGAPADVEANGASVSVTYSNIKVGTLNSTFTGSGSTSSSSTVSTSSTSTSSTTSPTGGTVAKYGQCGGTGYTGPTACVSGSTCTVLNPYFYQCL